MSYAIERLLQMVDPTYQEERTRHTARLDVERERTTGSRLAAAWKILNSGLVLWLLTSVVATGISWRITHHLSMNARREQAEQNSAALHSELEYRLSLFREKIVRVRKDFVRAKENAAQSKTTNISFERPNLYDRLKDAFDTAEHPAFPLHSEYKDIGVASLLRRLGNEVKASTKQDDTAIRVDDTKRAIEAWLDIVTDVETNYPPFEKSSFVSDEAYFEAMDEIIDVYLNPTNAALKPWSDTSF